MVLCPVTVDSFTKDLPAGHFSGLMGLAFSNISELEATPFWERLVDNGTLLDSPDMSFWFTRFAGDPDKEHDKPGGVFTLGGIREDLIQGEIEFSNVTNAKYWMIDITSASSLPLF
jgi:cathepsin D